MKKMGCKVETKNFEHIVDWDTFMNDDELQRKYCDIEIEKITSQSYNIMNFDEFIEDEFIESEHKWEKELKREDID